MPDPQKFFMREKFNATEHPAELQFVGMPIKMLKSFDTDHPHQHKGAQNEH